MNALNLRRKALMNLIGEKTLVIPSDNRYVQKISPTRNFSYLVFKEKEVIFIVHEAQYDYYLENEKCIITMDPEGELRKILDGKDVYSTVEKIGDIRFNLIDISKIFRKPFDDEIPVIREGMKILLKSFYDATGNAQIGMKENELRAEIDYRLIRDGMENFVHPTTVVTGKLTSVPLSTTDERKIEKGDVVEVDISPIYRGYELSLARVIFTDMDEETKENWKFYNGIFEVSSGYFQQGEKCSRIDEIAREYFAKKNIYYPHYTAYPSGGFSSPYIYPGSEDVLERNSLFIFSPGMYIKGKYGFRVKRTVLIKDHGFEFLDNE